MTEPTPVRCRFCRGTDTVLETSPVYGRGFVRWRCRSCGLADSSFPKPKPKKQPKTTRPTRHRAAVLPARKPWWLDRDEQEAFA